MVEFTQSPPSYRVVSDFLMIFDYTYVVSSRFADAYKPENCNPFDSKSEEWRHMQHFPPPYNDKIVLLIWITFPVAFPQRDSRGDSIGTLQIGYEGEVIDRIFCTKKGNIPAESFNFIRKRN